jgi:molybdopterin molybdotransferase
MKEFFKVQDIEQVVGYRDQFTPVAAETAALAECHGRVLAQAVHAPADLPGFSRSTMDGFALRAASTYGASESAPAYIDVVGSVAMGEPPRLPIQSGQAVRIATGGMLPDGADSVVMIEHTEPIDDHAIEVYRSVAPGQHVIAADEDFEKGQLVLPAGRRMRFQECGVLAALGITSAAVYRQPLVGIVSTGDEIVAADKLPQPGQVRDINSHTLSALVASNGGAPVGFGIVQDNYERLLSACRNALADTDMLLISGGSSVGMRDFTIEVLEALPQSRLLAHGVAISPGKPTILAHVMGKPVWGLPGHAVSAMVVFLAMVKPMLRWIGGERVEDETPPMICARLTRNVSSAQGRDDFVRVRLHRRDSIWWAEPVLAKSGLIQSMIHAHGLIKIGKNCEGLEQGAWVEVMAI